MQPLTRDRLTASAYRTLGLCAAANQSAIEAAARKMRVWPDASRIPPTPWDLPWLGKVDRSKMAIEQAVSMLNDPTLRVQERLLWFQGVTPPPIESAVVPEAIARLDRSAAPADQHDAALLALHLATTIDPGTSKPNQWQDVLQRFSRLSASKDYAQFIQRTESDGNFEKTASAAEIDISIASLPDSLAAAIMLKAERAIEREDMPAATALVSMLRSAGHGGADDGPMSRFLDRLEDALSIDCNALDRELRPKLQTNRQTPQPFYQTNYLATRPVAERYNHSLSVSLDNFCAMAADDPDRLTRARSGCAQLLHLIALGWEWSGCFIAAQTTLKSALDLANGSPFQITIRKDLERIGPLAERERLGTPWRVTRNPQRRGAAMANPPKKVKTKTAGFKGVGIWIWVIIAGVRMLVAISTPSEKTQPVVPQFNDTNFKKEVDSVAKQYGGTVVKEYGGTADPQPGGIVPDKAHRGRIKPPVDPVEEINREP